MKPHSNMTAKDQAIQIMNNFAWITRDNGNYPEVAKQCALMAVRYIINANPHSNPLNSEGFSTMEYWTKVYDEIFKLSGELG